MKKIKNLVPELALKKVLQKLVFMSMTHGVIEERLAKELMADIEKVQLS
jgi:hypothetical protein